VADRDDLKEVKVEADGKQIILSMVEGKVYAIGGSLTPAAIYS
jgi:hypothetical protein